MLEDDQPRSLRACSRDDPECGARRGVSLFRSSPRKRGIPACAGMSGRGKPRWSAERRASRVMGRKAPRKRLAYRVISAFTRVFDAHDTPHGCSAEHPNVSRRSAHPLSGCAKQRCKTPGAENAPRERDGLFDIVSWTERDAVLILRSAHAEENPQSTNGRARVSKDEDEPMCAPSCFETHRSALRLWEQLHSHSAAMLLSMRARGEAPTCGCGK
jgi:hypothetical protein